MPDLLKLVRAQALTQTDDFIILEFLRPQHARKAELFLVRYLGITDTYIFTKGSKKSGLRRWYLSFRKKSSKPIIVQLDVKDPPIPLWPQSPAAKNPLIEEDRRESTGPRKKGKKRRKKDDD